MDVRRNLRGLRVALAIACLLATATPSWGASATPLSDSRIVFSYGLSGLPSDIYTIRPDGSEFTNLTNSVFSETMPAWSPDGESIAFVSDRDGMVPRVGKWDIFVMNADGTDVTNVTRTPDAYEMEPAWAPDGVTLLFVRTSSEGSSMIALDTVSGEERSLGRGFNPDISPDGKKVLIDTGNGESAEDWVFMMNADGTGKQPFLSDDFDDQHAQWSPSGERIVFERDERLAIASPSGTLIREVRPTSGRYEYPTWAPNGRRLAVLHDGDIYTMGPAGQDLVQVTDRAGKGYIVYLDWM